MSEIRISQTPDRLPRDSLQDNFMVISLRRPSKPETSQGLHPAVGVYHALAAALVPEYPLE
jgi:hypothetical protein